ncbi:MAG: entericidin A/B family lipoprotein [Sphingopyxis sp.]
MMKRRILALLALALIAGCNTIEGAGRDIQSAGQVVEDAAD